MGADKPRMLIAEDSEIAEQLAGFFRGDFEVVIARTGEEAFGEVNAATFFDVCIVDIIMPVEGKDLALSAAAETGLRLIEHIVRTEKSQRFVLLTVRWDTDDKVKELTQTSLYARVLLKQTATGQSIREAVAEAMARAPGGANG